MGVYMVGWNGRNGNWKERTKLARGKSMADNEDISWLGKYLERVAHHISPIQRLMIEYPDTSNTLMKIGKASANSG